MRRVAAVIALMLLKCFAADGPLVTIPVKLSHGRIVLPARIADTGPFNFLLDTACTIPTLNPAIVDALKVTPSGHVQINGIAGEERAPTYTGVVFDLNGITYSPRRVASLPSERNEHRRRDGMLDAGLFRRFVVQFTPEPPMLRL